MLQGVSVVGVTQIDRVVEVVEQTLAGNEVALLTKKELPSLDLPKVNSSSLLLLCSLCNLVCIQQCYCCACLLLQ